MAKYTDESKIACVIFCCINIGGIDNAARADIFSIWKVLLPFAFSMNPAKEIINNKLVNTVVMLKPAMFR
jgi:hypothetical protein